MKRIILLFGGASKDYITSLRCAKSLIPELISAGFEVIPVGITRAGRWLFCPAFKLLKYLSLDTPEKIIEWEINPDCCSCVISPDPNHGGIIKIFDDSSISLGGVDCAISVLHGRYGECGRIQSLLQLSKIRFFGSLERTANIASDLGVLYPILESKNVIKVSPHTFVERDDFIRSAEFQNDIASKIEKQLGYPMVVRATVQSLSVGENYPSNKEELIAALKASFSHHNRAICEKVFPNARIFESAVINGISVFCGEKINRGFYSELLPLNEINVSINLSKRIKSFAINIYKSLCLSVGKENIILVRTFAKTPDEIYFGGITLIPGVSENSALSKMLPVSSAARCITDILKNTAL